MNKMERGFSFYLFEENVSKSMNKDCVYSLYLTLRDYLSERDL